MLPVKKAYQEYVQKFKERGEEPLDFDSWRERHWATDDDYSPNVWADYAYFWEIEDMIQSLLQPGADTPVFPIPDLDKYRCPNCQGQLDIFFSRTTNGLYKTIVCCPVCDIRKEWLHSTWNEENHTRALTDFITLVKLGTEYDNREVE